MKYQEVLIAVSLEQADVNSLRLGKEVLAGENFANVHEQRSDGADEIVRERRSDQLDDEFHVAHDLS